MQRQPSLAMKLLAIGLGLWLASGCATVLNPVTGEREVSVLSAEQETQEGQKAAEQVRQQMGLVEDPALSAYLAALGERVARFSPRKDTPYDFHVVKMQEVNAFALPGGHIYVSRGLLPLANSEDELANVLAHEVGHVAARHHAQRQTRATGVGIATLIGTLAAAALGGAQAAQTVGQLGQVAGAGLVASYGRDQERQSDEIGQKLAAQAGYDPRAMAVFLGALGGAEKLKTGRERNASFLDSHPATPERVSSATQRAAGLVRAPTRPIAATRADFVRRMEGLLIGDDPAEGVFVDQLFLHPGLDFRVRFPEGWRTANTSAAVAGQEPNGVAMLKVSGQGRGSDPRRGAEEFAAQARAASFRDSRSLTLNGLPAFRSFVDSGQGVVGEITWVALGGSIYRIDALAKQAYWSAAANLLTSAVKTFRTLTPEERASVKERRLHVVTAQAGETLVDLGRRTGNVWPPAETALMNGVATSARFEAGSPVKIAIERPYRAAK